jgi:hypothetical protein
MDAGGPGPEPVRGLSLFGTFARDGDLGPNENCRSPELGRAPFWERSSRALPDPECCPGEWEASRPAHSPTVKSHRWLCLSTNLMDLRVGTNTNRYGAAGLVRTSWGAALRPRGIRQIPRSLSASVSEGAFHLFAAWAGLLHCALHLGLRLPCLLSLVSNLVILSSRNPCPVLLSASPSLLGHPRLL